MPPERSLRSGLFHLLKRARGDIAVEHASRDATRVVQRDLRRLDDRLALIEQQTIGKAPGPFEAANDKIKALFENPRPWMVDEAVEAASEHLTRGMVGLEWGGGASTPYWCHRLGVLHTVEASPGWGLVLLDYMTHQLDIVDRWRLHFVGANWASTDANRRRTGRRMPDDDVRHRLEDDYAILIPPRVDALFLDGAVRQRTAERMLDYVKRDQPSVIVVDNTDKRYVANSIDRSALAEYRRDDFWGEQDAPDGKGSVPHCTSVWTRG